MKRVALLFAALLACVGTAIAAVNINSATKEMLEALDGVGPVKAQAIIDYRKKNGPFRTLEDIKKVDGIGEATFLKIRKDIALSGTSVAPKDDKPDSMREKAAATKSAVKEKTSDTKAAVKEKAADTKAAVKEKASDTKAAAKEKAADTKAAVKEKASDAKAAAKEKAADAKAAAKEKAADAKAAAEKRAADKKKADAKKEDEKKK